MPIQNLFIYTHGIQKNHSSIVLDENISEQDDISSVHLEGNELEILIVSYSQFFEITLGNKISEYTEYSAYLRFKEQYSLSSINFLSQRNSFSLVWKTSVKTIASSIVSTRQNSPISCFIHCIFLDQRNSIVSSKQISTLSNAIKTSFYVPKLNSFIKTSDYSSLLNSSLFTSIFESFNLETFLRQVSNINAFHSAILLEKFNLLFSFLQKEEILSGIFATTLSSELYGDIKKNTTISEEIILSYSISEINEFSSFINLSPKEKITGTFFGTTLEYSLFCDMAVYIHSYLSCYINSSIYDIFSSKFSFKQRNNFNLFILKKSRDNIINCTSQRFVFKQISSCSINEKFPLSLSFSRENHTLSCAIHALNANEINCSFLFSRNSHDCWIKVVQGYSLTAIIAPIGNLIICSLKGLYYSSLSSSFAKQNSRLSLAFQDTKYAATLSASFPRFKEKLNCTFGNVFEVHFRNTIISSRGFGFIPVRLNAFTIREPKNAFISSKERFRISSSFYKTRARSEINVTFAFKLGILSCSITSSPFSIITLSFARQLFSISAFISCLIPYEVTCSYPKQKENISCTFAKVIETFTKTAFISSRGFGFIPVRLDAFTIREPKIAFISSKERTRFSSLAFVDVKPLYDFTVTFAFDLEKITLNLFCIEANYLTASFAKQIKSLSCFIHCLETRQILGGFVGQKFNCLCFWETRLKYEVTAIVLSKPSDELKIRCPVSFSTSFSCDFSCTERERISCFMLALFQDSISCDLKKKAIEEISSSYSSTSLIYPLDSYLRIKERQEITFSLDMAIREIIFSDMRKIDSSEIPFFIRCPKPYNVFYSRDCRIICQRQYLSTYPEEQVVELEFPEYKILQSDL